MFLRLLVSSRCELGQRILNRAMSTRFATIIRDTGESVFAENLGETVPSPYGAWNLEAMDSHGGWIASAIDLAKFAAAFDDPDNCSDSHVARASS